jgi:hypothetical protein
MDALAHLDKTEIPAEEQHHWVDGGMIDFNIDSDIDPQYIRWNESFGTPTKKDGVAIEEQLPGGKINWPGTNG